MKTVLDFQKFKSSGQKISMVTCYDYWSACILEKSDIDCILVGDSLGMVMHGHSTTLPVKTELMALHTAAVARGLQTKFLIADLPFLSYRKDLKSNVEAAESVMQAGACAVKLEGVSGNESLIEHLVSSGVPVMGHIGLTPQSIYALGGFRVQGREEQGKVLLEQAKQLQECGSFSIVLECVPGPLAHQITQELNIPTIGIGAGSATNGQVLVLQDLLGFNGDFQPKFLRQFLKGEELITQALNEFSQEVKNSRFPSLEESYE